MGEGNNSIPSAHSRQSKIKGLLNYCSVLVLFISLALSIFGLPQEAFAAVTALNAWTNIHNSAPSANGGTINAGNITVSAGSDRLFLAAVCFETSAATTVTTLNVTLGSTTLTVIGSTGATSAQEHCYMGYLKHSQIPAGSNSLSVTYDLPGTTTPTVTGIHVKWASYSGVDQTTPINDSNANTSAATSVTFGDQIDYIANGLTLYVAANGGGAGCTMTPPSDFSQSQGNSNNAFTSFIATTANHGSNGNYGSGTQVSFSGTTQNRSAIVVAAINPPFITVGNNDGGGEPTSKTIGPGAGAEMLDNFTLQTSEGTDTVTGVTVTLQAGNYAGLSLVEITDNGGSTVYGSVSNPSSETVPITVTGMPTVTTSPVQYKVRITPKSHADMLAPPGAQYYVRGIVTGITSTYPKIYNDSLIGATTITVDNQSPSNPTGFSGDQSISGQVALSWTNPFSDFSQAVLLRNTSAIADTPVEGTTYSQGNTIGTSTVIYVGNSNNFTDTGLTNGVPYYYKIFAKDAYSNYSTPGTAAGPYTPGLVVTASSSGTQVATMNTGSTAQYIGAAFAFQQLLGTPDTITALTISETGNVNANTKLTNVKVYYESNVASCSYDGTESSYSTSFNTSDKIVLNSISIPLSVSPNYTCVYVVFDVDSTAINGTTVDLQITSSADFTLAGGAPKLGTYPVALSGTTTISGPINTFVKVGSFQSPLTGSNSVTGVGFQPQAVIFYWTKQTTIGFSAGESIGMGFAAAGSPIVNRSVAVACDDNVFTGATNCGRMRSETDSIKLLSGGNPSLTGSASVTSFDQDGFTVNWGGAPYAYYYINYIAISGSAITNAKAGTITATASAGNQSFDIGFQPDFVMFLSGLTGDLDPSGSPDMLFNTGFMNSAGEQAAISVCGRDNVTASGAGDSKSQQRTDMAIMGLTNTCTQDSLAKYGSMGANGFTLNFSDAPAADTDIFYLALKGGTFKIGSFNQATATGTQDITTVGFQPLGLFMASFNRVDLDNTPPEDGDIPAAEGEISIGAATSSTERGTIWGENRDVTSGNSDANMSITNNTAMLMATGVGTGTPTTNAAADFSSFLTNGFRLNWTTADATARQIVYWAIASNSTIVGNNDGGGEPTSKTIGPGAGPEELDAFTLKTSAGTDEVTGVTVTLQSGTYVGLSLVEITDNGGSTVYGSVSNPSSETVPITLGTNIPVTTTPIQYKVRITPKSHADMPAPPGSTYYVTGKVTVITLTSINAKIYNDSSSATITIDNQSPSAPFTFSGNASEGQVVLNWMNPFSDFSQAVILRNTAAITDTPTEGATYSQGNTIGTSTVIYVGNSNTFTDTGLTNGVPYYYKYFAKDAYGNYSSGTAAGPYIPGPLVTASSSGTQVGTMEAGSTAQYIGAAFRFQQSSGTADTISALTITETGTVDATTKLTNVKVYYESGQDDCLNSYGGNENSYPASFTYVFPYDKMVLNSISIPVSVSPKYTCVYVVFDVDLLAFNGTTVDLQITSSADFTLSSLVNKRGTYPVALSGSTTLRDTIAPSNITNLTVTPADRQITFNWTNPSGADFTGVRISRNEGVGGSPPADCSSGTWSVNVAAPATSYTNTGLTNSKPYFYRLCSYDEVPNYSTGVTISAIPSIAPVLSYPAAPYDDGKDPDTGDTTTDFTFKVIYSDWQNDPPDFALGYPKIYIGDNDGYMTGYTMEADTSVPLNTPLRDNDYRNGEQYVYGPIGLGSATDLRFYFKAKAATGDLTVVYLPLDVLTGGYSIGPSVYLLPGYNMVGVPKDLGTGLPYISVLGDDSGYSYCLYWDSYGLDITQDVFSGEFFYCTYGNIVHGTGYYIYALSGSPKTLDEPTGVVNVTAAYVDIALDPEGGWTLISNPYNAKIELQSDKVKIIRSATEYTFEYAITQGWIENTIYEWEGSVSGYSSKAFNGSPPATLDPWVGYFIYVKDDTTPIILRLYKPAL